MQVPELGVIARWPHRVPTSTSFATVERREARFVYVDSQDVGTGWCSDTRGRRGDMFYFYKFEINSLEIF